MRNINDLGTVNVVRINRLPFSACRWQCRPYKCLQLIFSKKIINIANNSTATEAIEKISTNFESLVFKTFSCRFHLI
jgi:hypothetical protein